MTDDFESAKERVIARGKEYLAQLPSKTKEEMIEIIAWEVYEPAHWEEPMGSPHFDELLPETQEDYRRAARFIYNLVCYHKGVKP